MSGYKGFGSFHSDNVEELLRIPEDAYIVPPLPDDVCAPAMPASADIEFGRAFSKHYFLDLSRWTFVNHGAFGASLRLAIEFANAWRAHAEVQPLLFYDRELFPHVVASLRGMAAAVHTSPTNIVFTPNATTGINAVIRSLKFAPDDIIFMLDIGYGSIKKLALWVGEQTGARVIVASIRVSELTSVSDFMRAVREAMPLSGVTLAVFDHITSNSAIVLPVSELVALAHERGARVLIDGAHALGTLDLNLDILRADYYVSNLHKWLSGCKGAAILYVAPELQSEIVPSVISHGFGAGFSSGFIWDGCRDYSSVLIVPSLLKFWTQVDLPAARSYCQKLLAQACALLCERWSTSTMAPSEFYLQMALVAVPATVVTALLLKSEPASDAAVPAHPTSVHSKMLQDFLHYERHVECPVKCLEDNLFVRISAAPYNCMDDYAALAEAVLAYCDI